MKNLIKKIQNTAFQNDLWQRGSKIVLGVSGGPDSVCLLDVLAKLEPKYDLKLIIAHVNYGLRGADSGRDEELVKKLAEEYKIKIEILDLKNPKAKLSEILKLSFRRRATENVMRDIRYEFFELARRENNFDMIAVAHNLDDQVETFLMRLIRGSGLKGLSAMRYKSVYPVKSALRFPAKAGEFNRGTIIRPFLGTTRAEILEYLNKTKRTYRTDKTNLKNLFFRNKVRNKLIPHIEKNFNPKIKKTIFDATISIADDQALLNDLAKKARKTENFFSAKKIIELHPSLRRRILLKKISEVRPGLKDIGSAHIEEMLKALRSTKGKTQVVLFKGLKMARKGDKVTISDLHNL